MFISFLLAYPSSCGLSQGLSLPNLDTLETKYAIDGNTIDVVPSTPADFVPPENGKLSPIDVGYIVEIHARLLQSLALVPEGEKGKDHSDFSILQQLAIDFQNVTTTKDRDALFATIPATLVVMSPSANQGYELNDARGVVSDCRYVIIQEVAFEVLENSSNVTSARHEMFVNIFCNREIRQEPDWEDEPMPIDSAGVFVTDATNSAAKLKTKTLEEIKTFLGGSTDNSFFERYESAGDGMNLLKTKYAANKATIQAKFAEVLAHVAQLEAQ